MAAGTTRIPGVKLGDLAHTKTRGRRLGQGRHVGRWVRQPLAEHLSHPRSALDGARAGGRRLLGEYGAEAEQPAAAVGGHLFHAAPLGAVHARNPVVLGEHVVHHDRIGGDEVDHWPVVHEEILEEPRRLLGQAIAHGRRELGEVLQAAAVVGHEVADTQPPGAKLLGHAAGPAVFQHPAELGLHHGGLVEPRSRRHELAIRDRIPDEEAQPRRQLHVRHRLPARPAGRLLDAVEKPWRREHAGNRRPESRIVLHAFSAVITVAGEDRLAFLRGDWPTPGPGGEGDELLHVPWLGHRLGGTECPLLAVHLLSHRLDLEKHLREARFVAVIVHHLRVHPLMRHCVFAYEMQFGPQPLEFCPAGVVEEEPPQRLVVAAEHE